MIIVNAGYTVNVPLAAYQSITVSGRGALVSAVSGLGLSGLIGTVADADRTFGPYTVAGVVSINAVGKDCYYGVNTALDITTHTSAHSVLGVGRTYSYIFDTDLDSDCDDIAATAVLIGMLDSLGGSLVAATVASNNAYAAPYLRVLLDYVGRTSVTLGAYKGSAIGGGSTSLYTQAGAAAFGNTNTRTDYSDSLVVLKAALLAATNGSVRIIVAGTCTNIAELILAYPRLVADKVEGIYVMGGSFDGSGVTENNILYDVQAANIVASFAGCKKVWAGYEVGNTVSTRITIDADPILDPFKKGWSLYFDPNPGQYRPSWDLMAVLNAVGGDAGVFGVSGPVNCSFASDSTTTFTTAGGGSNYYLTKTVSDAAIATLCHSYIDACTAKYQPLTYAGFAFGGQLNATASTVYASPTVTVTGLFGSGSYPVSVINGEYSKNGGTYTSTPGTLVNGDIIRVRGTSSAVALSVVTVTLLIGNVPSTFTITTVTGSFAYETESTALFARHTTQWATQYKAAANNFIVAAKAAGIWALMDVFYLTADPTPDSQRALLNWKGATYNGGQSGTGSFTTSGWQGNGTSGFIGSSYIFLTQDSSHMGCYSLTAGQSTAAEMGNTNSLIAVRGITDATSFRVNSAATVSSSNVTGSGHFCISRTSSTLTSGYKDGVQISNATTVSAAPAADGIRCGGRGGAGISFSTRVIPVFHMGSALTSAQVASLRLLIRQLLAEFGVL